MFVLLLYCVSLPWPFSSVLFSLSQPSNIDSINMWKTLVFTLESDFAFGLC